MLKGVIFDFDGIIVDTEPLHYRAFQEVLGPLGLGYSWDEYLQRYIGFDDRDALREAFRLGVKNLTDAALAALIAEKGAAFNRIISAGVSPYQGVVELIRAIKGNLPLALCSGALPGDIEPILEQLGLSYVFDAVVTAADVKASKPAPESYSLAVARLSAACPGRGVEPGSCLAVEDTPAGITSATAAGLKVLAVSNSYPAAELSGAIRVVDSLSAMDLETLQRIFLSL